MERIDLLWDAWEDCLCEEQLRAVFGQLTAENGRLTGQRDAYREETEGLRVDKVALTTENEKLKQACACGAGQHEDMEELVETLVKQRDEAQVRGDTLQSQLDRICLPIKTDGDVGHIRRTVIPLLRDQCKDISAQTLERVLDYLDSQETKEKPARCEPSDDSGVFCDGQTKDCSICVSEKPSEKQPKYHNAIRSNIQGLKDYRGVWHEGGIEDCPICKPKCEHKNGGISYYSEGVLKQWCAGCKEWIKPNPKPTRCPECHGTKYINRVVAVAEWEQHPCYMIADCLNCSGAKG